MKKLLVLSLLAGIFVFGCDVPAAKQDDPVTSNTSAGTSSTPPATNETQDPHADAGQATSTPPEGGAAGTDTKQGGAPQEPSKSLDELKTGYTTAKTAYEGAKEDAAKKKSYVDATVAYATAVMNDADAPPKEKYPGSLKLFREAVAIDPNNKDATECIATIEAIYKSMGRPVPN